MGASPGQRMPPSSRGAVTNPQLKFCPRDCCRGAIHPAGFTLELLWQNSAAGDSGFAFVMA